MLLWAIISFFLSLFGQNTWGQGNFGFTLNSWEVTGPLHHFWKSTGFCPPLPHSDAVKFDLGPDMQQNLAYIGAMPHRGIEQVRIHWLLELVKVISVTKDHKVTYNYTDLDQMMDLLHVNGLKPGFEIMGNPSNLYTNLEDKTQVYMWRDMVHAIAERYIVMYGLDYVKTWNFETWNEPDCNDFDNLKFTIQGFLNYYDACSEGLKAAHPDLIFGGPGDGCDSFKEGGKGMTSHGRFSEALLDHVVNGKNYFTGQTGVRIDFIAFHRKGDGHATNILNGELHTVTEIRNKYPPLASKPFYNDEADPLVGWSKPEPWRGSSVYAAFVAKVIAQHQNIIVANGTGHINYQLLSNDNGFLSYYPHQFTQRTLLARFQMNNTNPHHVTFVRKPVYAAMAMLSLLGDQQVNLNSGGCINTGETCGLATLHEPAADDNSSDSWQSTLLIYNNNDIDKGDWGILNVEWSIRPPEGTKALVMAQYGVNWDMGDPMGVWEGLYNATDFPTVKQFRSIRQQQGPSRWSSYPVSPNVTTVPIPPMFQVLTDDVLLMHLCAMSNNPPEQVTGLRFINITSGQVLVVWSDDNIKTKCIYTYEVEYSTDGTDFKRVNDDDTIVTAVVIAPIPDTRKGYQGDKMVSGHYRVRAVDYFKRPGPYSTTQIYQ